MAAAAVQVILMDIIPFMTLLSIAMLGCTIFFSIHRSQSGGIKGLVSTLVLVYQMMLGLGEGINDDDSPMMIAVVIGFTSFVVVVL